MIVVHNAQFHFLDAKTAVTVYSSSSLIPQPSPNQYTPAATTSTVDVFAATTSSSSHPRLFHEGLTVVGLVQIVSPTSADVFMNKANIQSLILSKFSVHLVVLSLRRPVFFQVACEYITFAENINV